MLPCPRARIRHRELIEVVERLVRALGGDAAVQVYAAGSRDSAVAVLRAVTNGAPERALQAARAVVRDTQLHLVEVQPKSIESTERFLATLASVTAHAARDERWVHQLQVELGLAKPQRSEQRYHVQLPCTLRWGEQARPGIVLNLSIGGMFVEVDEPPPRDVDLRIELTVPTFDGVIALTGAATHQGRPSPLGRVGVGVRLTGVRAGAHEAISGFLSLAERVSRHHVVLSGAPPEGLERALGSLGMQILQARDLSMLVAALTDDPEGPDLLVVSPPDAELTMRVVRVEGGDAALPILARAASTSEGAALRDLGATLLLSERASLEDTVRAVETALSLGRPRVT